MSELWLLVDGLLQNTHVHQPFLVLNVRFNALLVSLEVVVYSLNLVVEVCFAWFQTQISHLHPPPTQIIIRNTLTMLTL